MKRVLITEDEGLIAEIYRDSFDREGFSAEVARDGVIAIQRLTENPPDVVVLDLMMPNVNGVEVLKYIRSQDRLRELPVVVMSNAFASALGQEAAAAGATKMLAKNGCGPKRIVKEVRDLLATTAVPTTETDGQSDTATKLAVLRKDIVVGMAERIAALRNSVGALNGEVSREQLLDIHRAVHQLAGMISLAGFNSMAQLASALEALVKELNIKPQKVNRSSLRTVFEAVDTLGLMAGRFPQAGDEGMSSPLILVVDDDAIARKTACTSLEQARLRALSVDDPHAALKLAKENRFDLLLMDVQMPEMNGFQLCEQIRATAANEKTPVLFVTALSDFEAQVRSTSRSGVDFIVKPITPVELAVKALTQLLRKAVATS